jgi:hypothetical protein
MKENICIKDKIITTNKSKCFYSNSNKTDFLFQLFISFHIFHFKNEKKKQHKEAIVFKNRIYIHGTATIEIKLKYFEVGKKKKKKGKKRKHISNSIFFIIFKKTKIFNNYQKKRFSYRKC